MQLVVVFSEATNQRINTTSLSAVEVQEERTVGAVHEQCSVQEHSARTHEESAVITVQECTAEYSGSSARAMLSARGQCKNAQCKRRVQWELPVFDINASNSRRGVAIVHQCTPIESTSKYKTTNSLNLVIKHHWKICTKHSPMCYRYRCRYLCAFCPALCSGLYFSSVQF